MSAIFIGFMFCLVLFACLIGISLIAKDQPADPHTRPQPRITDADAVRWPRRDEQPSSAKDTQD